MVLYDLYDLYDLCDLSGLSDLCSLFRLHLLIPVCLSSHPFGSSQRHRRLEAEPANMSAFLTEMWAWYALVVISVVARM